MKFRWCGKDECYFLLAIQPTWYYKRKSGKLDPIREEDGSVRVHACLFEFFHYRLDVIFPYWRVK